jgi:ribosomal protein S18 acetylase RimI-like enzyme
MEEPGGADGTEELVLEPLSLADVGPALEGAELSEWFDPFLPSWSRQVIRAGGQAVAGRRAGRVVGLLLTDPDLRSASVYSRTPEIAEALGLSAAGRAVFAPGDLGGPRERFAILGRRLDGGSGPRLVQPVRLLGPRDTEAAAALLQEVYGGRPERWLAVAASEGEQGFGAEADGELVGVAWAQVVGAWARLHTLTVRPSARRRGLGAALVAARLLYGSRAGAREALAEVSEQNAASLAILRAAGFEERGELYLYPAPPEAPGLAPGAHRSA